jgi:hypothetical protein
LADLERKAAEARKFVESFRGRSVDELSADDLMALADARRTVEMASKLLKTAEPEPERIGHAKFMLGIWTVPEELQTRSFLARPGDDSGDAALIVLRDCMVLAAKDGTTHRILPYQLGKPAGTASEIELVLGATDLNLPPSPYFPERRLRPAIFSADEDRLRIAFSRDSKGPRPVTFESGKDKDFSLWELKRLEKVELRAGKKAEKRQFTYGELRTALADYHALRGTWEGRDDRGLTFDRGDADVHVRSLKSHTHYTLRPLLEPKILVLDAGRDNTEYLYELEGDELTLRSLGAATGAFDPSGPPTPFGPGGPSVPGGGPGGPRGRLLDGPATSALGTLRDPLVLKRVVPSQAKKKQPAKTSP